MTLNESELKQIIMFQHITNLLTEFQHRTTNYQLPIEIIQQFQSKLFQIKPRIGFCTVTIGSEYAESVRLGLISKQEYCQRWDYVFINQTNLLEPNRPIPWSKIKLLLDLIPKFDYLVWMDADILITNPNIMIEQLLLLLSPEQFLLLAHDLHCLNSGVMLIECSNKAIEFFQQVNRQYQFDHHPWWEQRSIIDLYLQFKNQINLIPYEMSGIINPMYVDPNKKMDLNNWCIHFAGVRNINHMSICMSKVWQQIKPVNSKWPLNLVRAIRAKLTPKTDYPVICELDYHLLINRPDVMEHLNQINKICNQEQFEGSCLYLHRYINIRIHKLTNKQRNLYTIAQLANQVLEIGFNAGHSCLLFLLANPNSKITLLDICEHNYVIPCFQYLNQQFPNRLNLIIGDSLVTYPQLLKEHPEIRYDLVHMDGGHATYICASNIDNSVVFDSDLANSLMVAQKFLVIDDVNISHIQESIDQQLQTGQWVEVAMLPTSFYPHTVLERVRTN